MPTFTPPTSNLVPATIPRGQKGFVQRAYQLFRFYGPFARGVAVLKIGGTYGNYVSPTQDQIDSATEVYLGGHSYTVTEAVKTALENAGYTVDA